MTGQDKWISEYIFTGKEKEEDFLVLRNYARIGLERGYWSKVEFAIDLGGDEKYIRYFPGENYREDAIEICSEAIKAER